MRSFVFACLAALTSQAAFAKPLHDVFRPVSVICRDGATGTSVKIEENVLGYRKRYEVTYLIGKPTLFVISKSKDGRNFQRVGLIDIQSDRDGDDIKAAHYLAAIMARDNQRFCKGTRREVLAARYELNANHFFNRNHPRYRGK